MGHPLFPASYSRLHTYETCALKAKFQYVDKLPRLKGPAASRGTKLHTSAEGFLLGEKSTIHKDLLPIKKILINVRANQPLIEYKIALDFSLLKVVEWKSADARFRLVIDSAFFPSGKVMDIQEWKSGRVYPEHEDQRRTYAHGSFAEWPQLEEVNVSTYYIDQGHSEELQAKRPDVKVMAWQLQQRLETMENDKHFAPRPGRYCNWCDYSKKKGGPCRVA